jgi:hypothetical protein
MCGRGFGPNLYNSLYSYGQDDDLESGGSAESTGSLPTRMRSACSGMAARLGELLGDKSLVDDESVQTPVKYVDRSAGSLSSASAKISWFSPTVPGSSGSLSRANAMGGYFRTPVAQQSLL